MTASTTRARTCRATGNAATTGTTSPPTSAASRTCSPRSSRTPSGPSRRARCSTGSPAAPWEPTIRSPGARTTSAAARSTPRSVTRSRASTRRSRTHLAGAIKWAAGGSDPVYSDCGATVLRNYQQVKISAPAEPQRADRLRPAARTGASSRPPAPAASGCTTWRRARRRPSPTSPLRPCRSRSGSTRTPRTASTARPSTATSRRTGGCTCTTRRRRSPTSSSRRARSSRRPRRPRACPNTATSLTAWDPYVGYFQLSRFKLVEERAARGSTWAPSSRSCKVPVNRGVLPRRGRHRLRPAQQPVAGHR